MHTSNTTASSGDFDMDELVSVVDSETNAKTGFPFEVCDRLRREAPVIRVEPGATAPFWMLTRQEEIRAVGSDSARFTASKRLIVNTKIPDYEAIRFGDITPIAAMDPPVHNKHRAVLTPRFMPKSMKQFDVDFLNSQVDLLLDEAFSNNSDQFDIHHFGEVFAIRSIAQVLGLPVELWDDACAAAEAYASSTDPERRMGNSAEESRVLGFTKLSEMFVQIIQECQKEPQDGMISMLANSTIDGDPMPMDQVLAHSLIIFFGGLETVRGALTLGIIELANSPAEYAKLRNDSQALVSSAVEEVLRWASPVIQFSRVALEDLDVGNTRVCAGETVVMVYPSANRDEAVFDDPYSFRLDRQPNSHLAFGHGSHVCVGNRFARLQLQTILLALSKRVKELEFIGHPKRACAFNVPSYTAAKVGIHLA